MGCGVCIRVGDGDFVIRRDECVVFVEIKARGSFGVRDLAVMMSDYKRSQIASMTEAFLAKDARCACIRTQFDSLLFRSEQVSLVLESAFDADGVLL